MEPQRYIPHLEAAYDREASQYRTDDDIEVQTENHQRLGGKLRQLCRSFSHPVRVLEIGCGTGRYFHWLENVSLLVGTDISAEMLKQAEHPVCEADVTATEIRLQQGDIYQMEFARDSFDIIYSLGVFGYGAGWTQALSDRVHRWLAPGGRLFFNAIEVPHSPNLKHRLKEAVKANIYPLLPAAMRNRLRARETVPIVRHARGDMEIILTRSGFSEVAVVSYACQSPLWNGVHVECSARKFVARVKIDARLEMESMPDGMPAMAA